MLLLVCLVHIDLYILAGSALHSLLSWERSVIRTLHWDRLSRERGVIETLHWDKPEAHAHVMWCNTLDMRV